MMEAAFSFLERLLPVAEKRPEILFNLLVLAIVIGMGLVLRALLQRHTRMIDARIQECEDAHLKRDMVQLRAMRLVSKLVTVLKITGHNAVAVAEYEREADNLVEEIGKLNREALEQRQESREALAQQKG